MNKLTVVSSPHIQSPNTTTGIMRDVIIALIPACIAAFVLYGTCAALLIVISTGASVGFEWLWCRLMKKPNTVRDHSAAVTGILLALNVPASLPVWQLLFGDLVAIIVVKQLFGGLGCNFINPALAARVVLTLSFTDSMTNYTFPANAPDALSSATPLGLIKYGQLSGTQHALDLFLGLRGGVIGCSCIAALLLGGLYLIVRGVIKPIIPGVYIGATFLLLIAVGDPAPFLSIMSGGLVLGAVFMATDYVTSPYTDWGKVIFALGCALITVLIRTFANAHEGVSYAIMLMNLLVPYINNLTRRRPFGEVKVK